MLHLPALAQLPSATIAGGCDLDQNRRDRAAERWKIPVFSDYAQMLEEARPDVVVVATPPEQHLEACLMAIDAGAHVICEKPLAPTIADGRKILDAARKAGRRVAMNYEFREMGIGGSLLDRIGTPGIGPLHFAHVWQCMDLPPWKEPGWRGQLSRGVLYEAGTHLVDYTLALFGERPASVWATMSTCGARDEKTDSVALVTLEFSGGRLAQITQNRLSPGDTRYFEVSADCAEATLRASFGGRARISAGMLRSSKPHVRVEFGASGIAWEERGATRRIFARNPKDAGMHATTALLRNTLAAFANDQQPPASGESGLLGLEVLAACYRSADTGNRFSMDEASVQSLDEYPIGQ